MAPTPTTTYHLLHSHPPSPSIVHIRSIPFTLSLGVSCWGQPHIVQPVLISSSVHFSSPFEAASRLDALDSGTVSYSVLAKEISNVARRWKEGIWTGKTGRTCELVQGVVEGLTGWALSGEEVGKLNGANGERGMVDTLKMDLFELDIFLPKASMVGEGVSIMSRVRYESGAPLAYAPRLELRKLRVSTLIGLRDFERRCKQMLVVNVVVDGWADAEDQYSHLEMIVTKTVEESTVQTLEALSHHIAHRILEFYVIPLSQSTNPSGSSFPQLRLCVEKPNMVPCSEAPVVEILFDCDPEKNAGARRIWDGVRMAEVRRPPFPLEGRLDEWIERESGGAAL